MYGFFKKSKSLFKFWFISFFLVFKISPGGQNQVLLGVKIECCLGSKESAPGVKIDCINTNTDFVGMHSILTQAALYLTPSSTWFRPSRLIFKNEKAINHNFKKIWIFWKNLYILKYSYGFMVKSYFLTWEFL